MTPYDAHPYTSMAYSETHPDRLEFAAHLLGLGPAPAPPARGRVLEVGCAGGGNLIPIAELNPDSEVVGIDLSATQIDEARVAAATLGLGNLELRHQDLVDFRDDRRFDNGSCGRRCSTTLGCLRPQKHMSTIGRTITAFRPNSVSVGLEKNDSNLIRKHISIASPSCCWFSSSRFYQARPKGRALQVEKGRWQLTQR